MDDPYTFKKSRTHKSRKTRRRCPNCITLLKSCATKLVEQDLSPLPPKKKEDEVCPRRHTRKDSESSEDEASSLVTDKDFPRVSTLAVLPFSKDTSTFHNRVLHAVSAVQTCCQPKAFSRMIHSRFHLYRSREDVPKSDIVFVYHHDESKRPDIRLYKGRKHHGRATHLFPNFWWIRAMKRVLEFRGPEHRQQVETCLRSLEKTPKNFEFHPGTRCDLIKETAQEKSPEELARVRSVVRSGDKHRINDECDRMAEYEEYLRYLFK